MATNFYSRVSYIGDGSTKIFSLNFPYINKTHVNIEVDGIGRGDGVFVSDSSIELSTAPQQGQVVTLFRTTPKDRIIDFQDGSVLNSDTLDRDSLQMLFITQEATDLMFNLITLDEDDAYDLKGKRLKNVANALEASDALNSSTADIYLNDMNNIQSYLDILKGQVEDMYQDLITDGSSGGTFTGGGSFISVRDFGAKGDSITDDAPAFQAAIDYAVSVGTRVVYVPDSIGQYALGSPVELPSNFKIFGDNYKGGELSKIKPIGTHTGHLIRSKGYDIPEKIYQSSIEGLFFDGSSTTETAVSLYAQECLIRDCAFKYMWTAGVEIKGVGYLSANDLALNNNIDNCYFAPSPEGARFYNAIFENYNTADTKITNNYIEGANNAGIESRGANVLIEGNHIFDAKHGVVLRDANERQIFNNYIENITHAGITVEGGSSTELEVVLLASGNIFRNINLSGLAYGVIELDGNYLNDFLITDNYIRSDVNRPETVPYFIYKRPTASTVERIYQQDNYWTPNVISIGISNLPNLEESFRDAETLQGHTYLDIVKSIYPIGSLYFNETNSSDPSITLGFGVWDNYGYDSLFTGSTQVHVWKRIG